MKTKSLTLIALLLLTVHAFSEGQRDEERRIKAEAETETKVSFSDTKNWRTSELSKYVGQTVVFEQPIYICNNYSNLTASMHRVMSATNQYQPLSTEYNELLSINNNSTFGLNGLNGYHRMGEKIYGMRAKINSVSSVTYISCDSICGSRDDVERGYPDITWRGDSVVKPDITVCAANLEYYLVENLGTGYGAANTGQQEKQHNKTIQALSKIRADIYGFVEIESGQTALKKIADALTSKTGRNYTYVNDGSTPNGSFTTAGYVYCSDAVTPYGSVRSNNTGVGNSRKKMLGFKVNASGEKFIFSINHFKAKTKSGASGDNLDQGDGQSYFNATRVLEAASVLKEYQTAKSKTWYDDEDILIMGDLNAYGMEDPIRTLTEGGMTDLHRYFHADSSYSYTYHGEAGYLDHAMCNATLLEQVTGMTAWHVNSDEHDKYTFDKQDDGSMFRYSDHDPVVVGLRLGAKLSAVNNNHAQNPVKIKWHDGVPHIIDADGGWYSLTTPYGCLMYSGTVSGNNFAAGESMPQGLYILNVYANDTVTRVKYYVAR